jgi:hypothetical protein
MTVLDVLISPYRSHSFETERRKLQAKIDDNVDFARKRVEALARENDDVVVELIYSNNEGLASLWRDRPMEDSGVAYLCFTVLVMLLVGLISPTSVPVTALVVAAIFIGLSVIGWMVKNAGQIEQLDAFVGKHWSALTFTDAIGEKAIYSSSGDWRHKCDFAHVTAVHVGDDEHGPHVAYREDKKTTAMLQRIRRPGDGTALASQRLAEIIEAKARAANPQYYEEGGGPRRGVQASI